jgi:hypothetical protein
LPYSLPLYFVLSTKVLKKARLKESSAGENTLFFGFTPQDLAPCITQVAGLQRACPSAALNKDIFY